ncbi:MAG: DUF3883 domain-containing protein [Anaerolineales bacterium]
MNRLDMAEKIKTRVPFLVKEFAEDLENGEKLRKKFVADFPISKIRAMGIDEYVIGKGADNRSFCYRIEREMDSLGRILGATAFKFGVYFGRTKSDTSHEYRASNIWKASGKEAFPFVKEAIAELLEAAYRGDQTSIAKNRLSPMFKGKILFLYFPEQFVPIYSIVHLKFFIAQLDINGSFKNPTDMQRALMEYRATWPELVEQPIPLFMRFLYDVFGHPEDEIIQTGMTTTIPLLDDAIKGAQFIPQLPAMSFTSDTAQTKNGKSKKTDFDKHQKQLKRTGDRGELIVIALEQKRLIQADKPELASRIKHVSQETDSAGYDILSFDEDGTPRQIEVKATRGSNLDRGFYISINELEQSKALNNYFIYFVFSTMTNKPRVYPIKHPELYGAGFDLQPITFHVGVRTLVNS